MKKEIFSTDTIFATVTGFGKILYKGCFSGMSSIADVMRSVKSAVGVSASASFKVVIRNYSRGWSTTLQLLSPARLRSQPEAVQLTLF